MGKKGGKKGKKGKKVDTGPPIVTNEIIRRARIGMLCPRLGDIYERMMTVENILEDVSERILQKAALKHVNTLSLAGMRMTKLPDLLHLTPELKSLIELNLSKNHLYNSDQVFDCLHHLPGLLRIDLSFNVLNGMLSSFIGKSNLSTLSLYIHHLFVHKSVWTIQFKLVCGKQPVDITHRLYN